MTDLREVKVPKNFARVYFPDTQKVAFLNKKTQVAQYEYPGENGAEAKPRTSKLPVEKPIKDVPTLFVLSPQPDNMIDDWEMCIAVVAAKGTDWEDPHVLFRNSNDRTIQMADPRPVAVDDELPDGWTHEFDEDGDEFFFDHNTNLATYDDPRLVEDPQPSDALAGFVRKRIVRPSRRPTYLLSVKEAEKKKKKVWTIGRRDRDAYNAIDNLLVRPDQIPEAVRNKRHNRYMDILPTPETRVMLEKLNDDEETTYYNANWVRGVDGNKKHYVALMGPLPSTLKNFWRCIWESNAASILMATGLVEKGKRKCERYWPAEVDGKTAMTFGDISVYSVSEAKARGYVFTQLKVVKGNETRRIGHFWYNTWPDHGVPRSADREMYPDSVLGLLHTVHKWMAKFKGQPVAVHCSAGIGRTGTLIAIDHCRQELKANGRTDPLAIIEAIRHDRPALVQHPQQFEFVHEACVKYAELHKTPFVVEEDQLAGVIEEEEEDDAAPAPRLSMEQLKARRSADKKGAQKRARESMRRGGRQRIMAKSEMNGELRRRPSTVPQSSVDAEAEAMWRQWDVDSDGKLSVRECRLQGLSTSVIREMDKNGDGFISLDEFKAYLSKSRAEAAQGE
eukprot:TRINITY_DN11555_c2_g2_i2.p1 TRINITY_DN11555_c2_g2~~TRINITY_DN11555_c2_g2_i2.p1  ORF type:complete len:619 (+),score=186.15 TRINITY_DN11555_c2_g2_i2:158-2014(+)